MPALQHFFDEERTRRGWSMREAAKRCQISTSKAYAITNGDDNVETETFENIATAFNMTAAELMTAIGKGRSEDAPERVRLHALVRQVPIEQVDTVDRVVRSFAIQPAQPPTRRADPSSKRRQAAIREMNGHRPDQPEAGSGDAVCTTYEHVGILAAIERMLRPRALAASTAS